jgi:HPt (histidine-containing phosphotransfer) domain-containing protein
MVQDPIQRTPPAGHGAKHPLLSDYHDDADMRPIVMMFLSEIPTRIETLQRHLASADRASFRRVVHQIKGAGGGYGFHPISDAAARLERCLDAAGDRWAQECHAHFDGLLTVLRQAHAGLAHMPQ